MFRGPELGTCCVLVATFCHCLFLARSLKYAIGYRKSLDFKQNSRPFKKSPQFCVLSTNSWRKWSFYGLIIFVVALNRLYVRFSVNSKIWRHEPLPVSKNITRCVFKRQSMFVPLSLQNLSSSCHCSQVVRLSHDKKTHNFIHCYEKGPNYYRWPKPEIWALANIDIVA